jgi:hypothetical protein
VPGASRRAQPGKIEPIGGPPTPGAMPAMRPHRMTRTAAHRAPRSGVALPLRPVARPHGTGGDARASQIALVQWPHFEAAIGTSIRQSGQAFVVGAAAGAASWRRSVFIPFTTTNSEKATITKFTTVLTKTP